MDFLSPKKRSVLMSRVRGKDTSPELIVRRIVRRLGYRFRTYHPSLPSKPDLVFPTKQKVILVHGCFWHRHTGCKKASMPKTRVGFWRNKFEHNRRRDRKKMRELRRRGWQALILWECETQAPDKLRKRIHEYLEAR